jgi:hypothetical protein
MIVCNRVSGARVRLEVAPGQSLALGRSLEQLKPLLDVRVSRTVAVVTREGAGLKLDVKSSNPLSLHVGDEQPRQLKAGDCVVLGASGWRLVLSNDAYCCPEEPAASPATLASLAASEEGLMTQTPVQPSASDSEVAAFLEAAGLGQFKARFREESITDLDDVKLLTESDLKALGIDKIGLVKKFQRAVTGLTGVAVAVAPAAMSPAAMAEIPVAAAPVSGPAPAAEDQQPVKDPLPPKEKQEEDGDVVMVDAPAAAADDLDVVIVEAGPPPPPPKCQICNDKLASLACALCADKPVAEPGVIDLTGDCDSGAPKLFCYKCFQDKHPPSDRHAPQVLKQETFAEQQREAENANFNAQNFIKQGIAGAITAIRTRILSNNFVGPARMQSLQQEVQHIADSLETPPLIVLVLGDTGAGKSSMLNALIGERSVLPTNGMRACTASLVEMAYNYEPGAPYRAVVELLTPQEWQEELETLLHDITLRSDPEACLPRSPDADSPAGIAMAKVRLVYGVQSIATVGDFHDVVRRGSMVTRALGKVIEFEGHSAVSFRKQLEQYADSSDQSYDVSFWPVVKRIKIFGRWPVLKS